MFFFSFSLSFLFLFLSFKLQSLTTHAPCVFVCVSATNNNNNHAPCFNNNVLQPTAQYNKNYTRRLLNSTDRNAPTLSKRTTTMQQLRQQLPRAEQTAKPVIQDDADGHLIYRYGDILHHRCSWQFFFRFLFSIHLYLCLEPKFQNSPSSLCYKPNLHSFTVI